MLLGPLYDFRSSPTACSVFEESRSVWGDIRLFDLLDLPLEEFIGPARNVTVESHAPDFTLEEVNEWMLKGKLCLFSRCVRNGGDSTDGSS